jgi:urea transport system ATP-binding protein
MLQMQARRLLLVGEPVAGMTDHETARTAELLAGIAGTRSVVVVEQDLDFVRALGCRVTVLHEGTLRSERSIDHVQNEARVVDVHLGR